jgi:hypothetical protein
MYCSLGSFLQKQCFGSGPKGRTGQRSEGVKLPVLSTGTIPPHLDLI